VLDEELNDEVCPMLYTSMLKAWELDFTTIKTRHADLISQSERGTSLRVVPSLSIVSGSPARRPCLGTVNVSVITIVPISPDGAVANGDLNR
jgi:hypothetical protein